MRLELGLKHLRILFVCLFLLNNFNFAVFCIFVKITFYWCIFSREGRDYVALKKGIDLYKVLIGPFGNPETGASRVSFLPLKTRCEEGAFLLKSNVHTSFSSTSVFMFCFSWKLVVLLLLVFFSLFPPPPPPRWCLKNHLKTQVF